MANQTLSLFAFLCITAWMFENGKGKWAWIPMIPGCFYTFICVTYIANAHIGFNIPWTPGLHHRRGLRHRLCGGLLRVRQEARC